MKSSQLLVLFVFACAIASASSITHSNILLTTGGSSFVNTNWSDTLLFPEFDPSLGTLTEADFTVNGSVNTNFEIHNLASDPSNITATVQGLLILKSPDGISNLVQTTPSSSLGPYSLDPYLYSDFSPANENDFSSTDAIVLDNQSASGSVTSNITTASILSQFIGTGFASAPISATGQSSASGDAGAVYLVASTSATANGSVTYFYTPTSTTPEPGAFGLAGSALLLAGTFRWKRRKN